nr:RuBisCO long chain, Form III-c [uncultured bacterium]
MSNLSYLHLGEKIDKAKNIIATFRVESNLPLEEAAGEIAAESSIGTWTKVGTLSEETFKKLGAKVFWAVKIVGEEVSSGANAGLVKIAYPLELFEMGNIPQLLSSVAGNIFSMKKIIDLRLEDLEFPEEYVKSFSGPAFGIDGVREITGIKDRPLIGSIIKPKMGLSAKEHAKVAYECFSGGVDLVKDDENLTDQKFNRFNSRVKETLELARKAEKEIPSTRDKKICAFNTTAETNEMIKRAKFIKKSGGSCAMADIITLGFGAVQSLRNENLGLIIHGHRAMHSAFTRNPRHGISMLVIAKLARLAGVDQLHTGTVVGKMEGGEEDVLAINKFLLSDWHGLKPVLPIASGGLHPALVPELVRILGKDVIINFGGGIHGHPEGTLAGARAARQAVEAAMKNIPLRIRTGRKEIKERI